MVCLLVDRFAEHVKRGARGQAAVVERYQAANVGEGDQHRNYPTLAAVQGHVPAQLSKGAEAGLEGVHLARPLGRPIHHQRVRAHIGADVVHHLAGPDKPFDPRDRLRLLEARTEPCQLRF